MKFNNFFNKKEREDFKSSVPSDFTYFKNLFAEKNKIKNSFS